MMSAVGCQTLAAGVALSARKSPAGVRHATSCPLAPSTGPHLAFKCAVRGMDVCSRSSLVAERAQTTITARAAGGRRRDDGEGGEGGGRFGDREKSEFSERVVQVRRVTKVVKGGKQLSFRAVVVIGDEKGQVGVGVGSSKEVATSVQKAVTDAKRHLVRIPLTKASSFPHQIDGFFGAAKVMLRPAAEGTGVIAGGAVRIVLEMAGVKNGFGKQLGTDNPLNNARAAIEGLKTMKTYRQVAEERGVPLEWLLQPKQQESVAA